MAHPILKRLISETSLINWVCRKKIAYLPLPYIVFGIYLFYENVFPNYYNSYY